MNRMTRPQLLLRTFGWAAVGFLVTNGTVLALGEAFEVGDYRTGVVQLTLAVIAAVLAGVVAVLQSLKFSTDTAQGKAASQFVQMLLAGAVTLGLADLTEAAAVAFGAAALKLVIASAIGALQAFLVNQPAPPPQPPVVA